MTSEGEQRLYRETLPIMGSSALRLAGKQDAGDLVQETYMRALTSIARFRGECRLATRLFRILCNEAAARKRKGLSHTVLPLSPDCFHALIQDVHARIDLERALTALRASERKMIFQELEGCSTVEIARGVGVSAENSRIRAKVCPARRKMQLALAKQL